MNIGINNTNINKIDTPKKREFSSVNAEQENKTLNEEKSKVNGSLAAAIYGIKTSPVFGTKQKEKQNDTKTYVENLPFAEKIKPSDKRNLTNILQNDNEEAVYMKKLLNLVCEEKVTTSVTQALCEHGVMSDLVKKDIDTYYDKVIGQGMSLADAFVPLHQSQQSAEKEVNIGDVFRIANEDKIYVKTDDNASIPLEIDAETYLKLYPPVERFSACQNANGDCFFLSSVNSIMENPKTRAAIYNCFTQDGKDIIVHLPDGEMPIKFKNGELPDGYNQEMYADGPLGMKLLEHMFGYQIENQKYAEYQDLMSEKIEQMETKLEKLKSQEEQDDKAVKKQNNLSKKILNYKNAISTVDKAMSDPEHKMVFVLDDLGEFVMGKSGPMINSLEKIDENCSSVSNYYIGFGGDTDITTQAFGFYSESYETGMDDDIIEEALFADNPDDYIISATTYDYKGDDIEENSDRAEIQQNESYSIYSKHAYKILPFNDEDGNRMFKVTNPWNQSHRVVMDFEKLTEFFEEFSITDLTQEYEEEC